MRPAFSTNAIGCTTPSANKDARASQNAVDETTAPTVALRAPRDRAASIRSPTLIRRAPTPAAASRPSHASVALRMPAQPAATSRASRDRRSAAASLLSRSHRHRRRTRNEPGGCTAGPYMPTQPAADPVPRLSPLVRPLAPANPCLLRGHRSAPPLAPHATASATRPRFRSPRPTSASAPLTPSSAAQRDASPAASPSSASATARSAATFPLPSSPSTRPAAPAQPSRLPNSAPSTSTASGYA